MLAADPVLNEVVNADTMGQKLKMKIIAVAMIRKSQPAIFCFPATDIVLFFFTCIPPFRTCSFDKRGSRYRIPVYLNVTYINTFP